MAKGVKKGNVNKLLDGSLISYYWLGFILADGSFSDNNTRLRFKLGKNNQQSVKELCGFLEKTYTSCNSCAFMSKDTVPKITELLGLSLGCKTYNPPDLVAYTRMADDKFLALIIGFIDGDGCIRHQTNRTVPILTVKLHSSWELFLRYVHQRLFNIYQESYTGTVKINNAGYVRMNIGQNCVLKQLKQFTVTHSLPVISYKWDKIDLNYLAPADELIVRCIQAKELQNQGLSITNIAKHLNVTYIKAYHALRRS